MTDSDRCRNCGQRRDHANHDLANGGERACCYFEELTPELRDVLRCRSVNRAWGERCELLSGHAGEHQALSGESDEIGDIPPVRWTNTSPRPARDGETCDERFDGVADARLQCRDYPNGSTGHTANPSASERDGETLSGEPTLKEKVRAMFDFLDMAPEAIRECHAALSSICETLGLDYRSTEISDIPAEVAALRAQLADARVELKTVVDSVDDALFAMREPMTLGEARKGRAILTSYSVRRAIAAARAASGEDANGQK